MASTQSNTAVVACPKCGSPLAIPRSLIGKRARCASCSTAFAIAAPANQTPTAQAAPTPPAKPPEPKPKVPEHVGFNCRVCSARLFALTQNIGQNQKCEECGALTVIPPLPAPKHQAMPAAMDGEQYELWDADEQPLPSELIATAPKTVMLQCRRCDTVMNPETRLVGQPIRCPDCGTTNIVPPPPRPAIRRSVLTPDAATPQLDPAAAPGERAYVPVPVGTMLHEDEQEAEYRRALEKSQRTGRPMEIDYRGRPIMPRWPLISGVLPFLFTSGVGVAWLFMSLGLGFATKVLVTGIAMAGNNPFMGVPLLAGGSALMMIATAGVYSCLLQIIMESSEGNRKIHGWPVFTDWLASLLYVGVAIPMSAVPGFAISRIPAIQSNPELSAMLPGISIFAFLPIVMLSQLDINSPAGILSGRILGSLLRCPFSWITFYIEIAILAAICVGATYWVEQNYPGAGQWLMPLYVAAMILSARLLGRLAWRLAEAMAIEEKRA